MVDAIFGVVLSIGAAQLTKTEIKLQLPLDPLSSGDGRVAVSRRKPGRSHRCGFNGDRPHETAYTLVLTEGGRRERMCMLLLFDTFLHLLKRVGGLVRSSVGQSVRHARVEFLKNGLNLNEISPGHGSIPSKKQFRLISSQD